ncbi:MAG: ABC transporter permease subunit [Eubacteriales bacterium]|nr:ABC transporter permease subunit [Eubacteriales bacterium]
MLKTIGGFLLASLISIFAAFLSYYFKIIQELLDPFISLIKAIPVASYVILVLIWIRGSSYLSFVIAFLVVFPVSYINILNGLINTDKKLLELAKIFHVSFFKKLKYVYIPAIKPFLLSSFETTIGMSWKSGIAAELIGQPQNTIGYYLYQSKVFLDTADLFAWTFVIVILSYVFEKICTLLIKRYFKANP